MLTINYFKIVQNNQNDKVIMKKYSDFKISRKVQLHETDLGGLMHHHNYFLWMEQAEYEMFEDIGEKVVGDLDENFKGRGWPRSKVSMKFLKPLRYGDLVEIHLKITRIRNAAIEYETDFWRLKEGKREKVSIGKYQTISCLYDSLQGSDPIVVPADEKLLEKLEVYS